MSAPDPVGSADDPALAAHDYIADLALRPDSAGRVGLELEHHLVDLAHPARRPGWAAVQGLISALPPLPGHSSVTAEPGGQLELSTPPCPDLGSAVAALRQDTAVVRRSLRDQGYAAVAIGTDPVRPAHRVNPRQRYAAMERHFRARGCGGPGAAMMNSTAALQVNLDAGRREAWASRLELLRKLTPVLVAISSTSPYLAGRSSGWHSMRAQVWRGVDPRRSGPFRSGEPTGAWADYALQAPVMLVRTGDQLTPVVRRVSLAEWLADPARLGRPATSADVDHHLTTLFPPVRPRGYVEVRCLDALPERWWPAVAALTVTLVDDPVAADLAADACASLTGHDGVAARSGLADPDLRRAVTRCADIAARRTPDGLRAEVENLAELLHRGHTPSDRIRSRVETVGPLRVLEEETDA